MPESGTDDPRADERWSCLALQYRECRPISVRRQALNPVPGGMFLPLLATAPISLHDLGRWHADRVEVVASYPREIAGLERANRGGLPSARGTEDEEKRGGHEMRCRCLGHAAVTRACHRATALR